MELECHFCKNKYILGKQDGGYNTCISIQTLIFRLVVNFIHPKTLYRSALWCYPIFTVAMRLLGIFTKVMNLNNGEIKFRHLRFRVGKRVHFSKSPLK